MPGVPSNAFNGFCRSIPTRRCSRQSNGPVGRIARIRLSFNGARTYSPSFKGRCSIQLNYRMLAVPYPKKYFSLQGNARFPILDQSAPHGLPGIRKSASRLGQVFALKFQASHGLRNILGGGSQAPGNENRG